MVWYSIFCSQTCFNALLSHPKPLLTASPVEQLCLPCAPPLLLFCHRGHQLHILWTKKRQPSAWTCCSELEMAQIPALVTKQLSQLLPLPEPGSLHSGAWADTDLTAHAMQEISSSLSFNDENFVILCWTILSITMIFQLFPIIFIRLIHNSDLLMNLFHWQGFTSLSTKILTKRAACWNKKVVFILLLHKIVQL